MSLQSNHDDDDDDDDASSFLDDTEVIFVSLYRNYSAPVKVNPATE